MPQSSSDQKASLQQKAIERITGDVLLMGKIIAPNTFELPTPQIHRDIAELFMNSVLRLLNIIAPRGIAKTTIVMIYVLYHLFVEQPGKRKFVVIISKTQPHAKSILQSIKNILDYSRGFRDLFGYHGEHNAKRWREDSIILDTGDGIDTRGTGQAIRGINLNSQRPTLIIVDDPEDENNTKTQDAMEKNLAWLLNGAAPSLDAVRGRMIVIGTPLHELCTVIRLKSLRTFTSFHYGNDSDAGIALWPESKSLEWLKNERDAKRDIGLVHQYYQEYECKLVPGGDAMFLKKYIQYYPASTKLIHKEGVAYLLFESGLTLPVNVYMGIDPASSTRNTADYSTIVPIAMDGRHNIYVLPYFRKRVQPLELADNIEAFYLRNSPNLTLIESTGYQEMLRQYMRTKMFIPGLEIKENPRENKSARLEMLQPFFAQMKVFLMEGQQELEDELLLYPKSKHDDLMDGLYYAVKRARAASHTPTPERPKLPEHEQVIVDYYEKEEDDSIPIYADVFEDD